MDTLFKHTQEKSDTKSTSSSKCDLLLTYDGTILNYSGEFFFNYISYNNKKSITFHHEFSLDIESGDIIVMYKIMNNNLTEEKSFRDVVHNKKNNFKQLVELTDTGFLRGEKRFKYWGVKYMRATEKMFNVLEKLLKENFKSEFYKNKDYKDKYVINPIYDLLIDFHLDKKNIKPHDYVYWDIQHNYPKVKWLKKNDYKYLPAVLDEFGIKSKYIISELNKTEKPIFIDSIKYICKLFGDNYIDYLNKSNWKKHCGEHVSNKKIHKLKNDSEKKFMLQTMNNWDKDSIRIDSFIESVNKLLSLRDFLEVKGLDLKYKGKDDYDFENTHIKWATIKKHFNRGYKVKYSLPETFIKEIEEEIIVNDLSFKPKLLLSEEDFTLEGFYMKNCMSNQFAHGAIYLYLSLEHKRKRINLQYRKGRMVQSYGKTNSPVEDIFTDAINVLNKRLEKNSKIEWAKEKYDIVYK